MAPMLFLGMIPTARADDVQEPIKDNAVIGPGMYSLLAFGLSRVSKLTNAM